MRFGVLRSIGHNIADSFASGIGLLIGHYTMDIFGEAQKTRDGVIEVDFLNGKVTIGRHSRSLAEAVALYSKALPGLCVKHRADVSAFKTLTVRFGVDRVYGRHFTVTVEDVTGRRAVDQYIGSPGRRIRRRISHST